MNSSSITEVSENEYDVFISFRRIDIRKHFIEFLYEALTLAGICVFHDDGEPCTGEDLGHEVTKAMKESKLVIAVLSKNYASSKRCLKKLTYMMELRDEGQRKLIVHIFHMVQPTDMRRQMGSYEVALHDHIEQFDQCIVRKWRRALKEVADIPGWVIHDESFSEWTDILKFIAVKVKGEVGQ